MAKKPIRKHPTVTVDHHKAIAKIVIEVSRMEWLLELLFQTIMHHRGKTGRAVVSNVKQYEAFSKVAKAVLHEMVPSETKMIDKLFDEMNAVRKERHKIVHGHWGKVGKRVYLTKLAAYTGKFDFEYRTALQIDAIAERATAACAALIWWQNEVQKVLFPTEAAKRPYNVEKALRSITMRAQGVS